MLGDERLELGNDVGVAPELEVCLDPLLDREGPALFESSDLSLRERFEREIGERRTAPERECLAQEIGCLLRVAVIECVPAVCEQLLEVVEIEAAGLESKQVAGALCDESAVPERSSQVRDVVLDDLRCGRGSALPPELFDDAIRGDRLVRVQNQQGKEGAPPAAGERDCPVPVANLERAEDPKVHMPPEEADRSTVVSAHLAPPRSRRVTGTWTIRDRRSASWADGRRQGAVRSEG